MDGYVIKPQDVYELFYNAVEFKCSSQEKNWNSYSWWQDNKKTYWEKIIKVSGKQISEE